MTLKQIAKNNMYKAVLLFLSNNAKAFGGFKRLQTAIVLFVSQNQTLDDYITEQAGTSTGVTGAKDALFTAMCQMVVKAARKAAVYAKDINDSVMHELFDVQIHDLTNSADSDGLAKVENIYKALLPLSGMLDDYMVSAADIAGISTVITAYEAAAGTPQNTRAQIEAGTKGIEATIILIDENLGIIDDLIVHGIDDVDLVNTYRKVRRIIETGTRHTGLVATINDASGTGIGGVQMLVQELKKTAMSDILGVADIESMKLGMYHVIFSAPGYATQTQILKIEQGKTLTEEVVMVKE